ncbi:hypothetical protein CROQUDRAFT_680248 [Cronartium quercuum f. sp. fusiforme G11]|uniref:Uncharacterized protein n=1 Tax=Cronartium quercuum f. sp. fusiforme G11 TaxID=708437 RepID=A0A9P6NBM7_9BASI|nr:hypothetical protein CROQUDRAFT_680248 [Cronartium quercuum f. sp. fusiforme G11]
MSPNPTHHGPSRNLYEVLELPQTATRSEIRAAYHRLAKLSHPDKNPGVDPTIFHELQQAYEVLSDVDKKAQYDNRLRHTESMSGTGFGSFTDPTAFHDLFQSWFKEEYTASFFEHTSFGSTSAHFSSHSGHHHHHHHHHHHQSNGGRKTADSSLEFECTLEDLMNGRKVAMEVQRQLGCEACEGLGFGPHMRPKPCQQCDGQGFIMTTLTINGLLASGTAVCTSCQGAGEKLSQRDRCSSCRGSGLRVKKERVEWKITKGMLPGEVICLPDAGDAEPGCRPGNLLLHLKLAPHPTFKTLGSRSRDLILPVSITLSESLLGLDRLVFHHLDGRGVRLRLPPPNEPGYSIIKPGEERVIRGAGLPSRPRTNEPAGDLWIKFEIEWPSEAWVASQDLDFLKHALPAVRPDLGPSLPASTSQIYLTLQSGQFDHQSSHPK